MDDDTNVLPQELGRIESPKETALKLASYTFAASIINMIISIPIRLINASVLGPSGVGLIRLANVVESYAAYADLGMRHSLIRQVPLALGAGNQTEAEAIRKVVFTWTWMVSFAVVLILSLLFAAGFTFKGLLNLLNLILLSTILITDRFNAYLHSLAKGWGRFDTIGQNTFSLSILSPLISLPAVVLWGVTGFLFSYLLLKFYVTFFYIHNLTKSRAIFSKFSLPMSKFSQLSKIGLLLWAIGLSETVFGTIGLSLLAIFLGAEDVGLFGFAMGLLHIAIDLASPFSMVAYRHMLMERGAKRDGDQTIFRKYLERPFVTFLLVITIGLGFSFFGYECAVRLFLPKFIPALPAAKVVILGYMFFGMTYFTGAVLNVSDELRKRLFIVWIALGLNGGLDILLLSKGYGILGVAWGSTISYVILAVGLLLSCNRMVYGEYRIAIIFLLRFLFASTILWLGLHILDGWQIGEFLKELPRILNVGGEFAFAGLKFLIYASFALLLYGILFLPYKPVDEFFHSAKYMVSLFKKRISQKSSLVVN